ncbi:MAG: ABC transporter substrate-binding protein [Chitinophagales bacterium]
MKIINSLKAIFFLSIIGLFISCGDNNDSTDANSDGTVISKRAGVNEVIVQMNADPDKLNYVTATAAVASEVKHYIFESLTREDPTSLKQVPYLAKKLAEIEEITVDVFGEKKEGLKFTYEIREEANWPDGSPITGYDAEFYVKCNKNPKVDAMHIRPYFEALVAVEVDKVNPKKLSVIFQDKYFLAESLSGLVVLQKDKYDPEGLMESFSIQDLSDPSKLEALKADKKINDFATMFNSEKFSRDVILGSGPYIFKKWDTGERIVLERNENWWAKDLIGKETPFHNGPDKIVFEIIVDNTTAKTAQKDEGLDIMKHTAKDYVDLKDDKLFLSKYKFELPVEMAYSYIGINTKSPKLSDKNVRKALAMALDYETLKKVFLYGLAERTVSPIHPLKNYYNKDIKPYLYNLQAASAMLDKAGWVDSDGDGIRDKDVDGDLVQLDLEFKYPSGSDFSENMALVFKKSLSQIGVNMEVVGKEWTVYLEDTKSHNFELSTAMWSMGPGLSDMKQIWHTDSYNGGSNYVGFGNAYSDKLIESIRYELDEEKRNKMYYEIQEIIYDEVPYIFLFTRKAKVAIHKRFDDANAYSLRPNYFVNEFNLNPSWGATQSPE